LNYLQSRTIKRLSYTLGLKEKKEENALFNDKPLAGALTMTSVIIE